jgi:FAD/FMN-containing dehydrogenase
VVDAVKPLHGWPGPWPDVFYYTGKRDRLVVGFAADTMAAARRTTASPAFAHAQIGVAAWLARFPNHLRVWSDFMLPAAAVPEFLACVSELRGGRAFTQHLRTIYLLGVRTPRRSTPIPLSPGGDPPPDLAFGVGLYCMVPAHRPAELNAVRDQLRRCLERCIELGGRPYMYGWHELDDSLLQRAFGPSLHCLRALRREHDPHGLFTSVFEAA